MLNEILNGALGESSSRSGSSSSSRSNTFVMPASWKKTMTAEAFRSVASQQSETQQPTVTAQETEYYLDTPIAGRIKVSESAYNKYKYASDNWGTYLKYCKDNDIEMPIGDLWEMLGENGEQTLVILQNMIESRQTPPQNVIPENVVPMVSVAPSEDKGNSLLIPGIILALGVIGAIALTSKSKKRR